MKKYIVQYIECHITIQPQISRNNRKCIYYAPKQKPHIHIQKKSFSLLAKRVPISIHHKFCAKQNTEQLPFALAKTLSL